jgi:hypothetical protein
MAESMRVRKAKNAAALTRFQQDADARSRRTLEELQSDDGVEPSLQDAEERTASLEELADAITGEEKLIAKASAAISRELADRMRPYTVAYESLMNSGSIDPTNITSIEDIDRRLALANELVEANDDVLASIPKMPARFEALLLEYGYPKTKAPAIVNRFRAESKLPILIGIRTADGELFECSGGILRLLKETWGHWEVEPETGALLFESDEVIDRYNDLLERLQAAAKREGDLQKQFYQAASLNKTQSSTAPEKTSPPG